MFLGTLFVKKRVRVQSPSDPLAKIKDLVRQNSREDVKSKSSRPVASQETVVTNQITNKVTVVDTSDALSDGSKSKEANTTSSVKTSSRPAKANSKSKDKKHLAKNQNDVNITDVSLTEDGLVDGLRVLVRIEGHFYPGRLNSINPPDIYGVLLDNERGYKPHIYAREELIKNVIRDVRIMEDKVEFGTRVCAYWSSKYVYLHAGTVVPYEADSKLPHRFVNVPCFLLTTVFIACYKFNFRCRLLR